MTSTLALVSLFTEVFAAGMVVAGLTSFGTRAFRERSVLDVLRTILFAGLLLYILTLISTMVMASFGGTPEGHWGLEWLKAADLIFLSGVLILLMVYQRPGAIVPTGRGSLLFLGGFALAALLLAFINPHMIIRPGFAEPYSIRYLPIRIYWQVIWAGIGILSWVRSRISGGEESAPLWRVLAGASMFFILAAGFREAYWVIGSDLFLLASSACRLAAVTGLLLSQLINPGSELSKHPLRFFQTKLLYRLLLLFVFLIVALFGVTTILASGVTKTALSRSILAEERSVALELASQINSQMDSGLEMLRKGVNLPGLARNPQAALAILLETAPHFDGLVTIRPTGAVVSVTRPNITFSGTELQDIKNKTGLEFGYRSPIRYLNKELYLLAAYRTPDGQILAGRINLKIVRFLVDEMMYGRKSGSAYVVDDKGTLIAGPRLGADVEARSLAPYPWIQSVLKGYVGGDEYINHDGEEVVGSYVPVRKMGWGVLVERPKAEAYAEISDVQGKTLFVTLVGILIAILAGVFFAGSIERSIVQLIEGTREVRKGNLKHHITVDSQDEIGQLADAFNQMTWELRESQEHLISSEKFAAMGTMATGMAHEIKNPLVSLRTFAQLLPQRWHDEEFRKKFAQIVPNEVDRINKIAENLLRFGRPAKPEFSPTNVNEVFGEVLSLLEPELKKAHVKVTTKFADLPRILADSSQLSQVFLNLFLNAIQAMPNGGDLTVKTDVGHMIKLGRLTSTGFVEEKPVGRDVKGSDPQPVVFIEITDTGTGIPEENLKNLFDPFFTTKIKGTGMGLPISLRIIEEHRGTIRVRSRVGKGTTFVITLPQENA